MVDGEKCRNCLPQPLTVARCPTVRPLWSRISNVSRDAATRPVRFAEKFR